MKKNHIIAVLVVGGIILGSSFLNKWIAHQVDTIVDQRLADQEVKQKVQEEKDKEDAIKKELEELKARKVAIEKIVMDPNREYEVHIIFLGEREMARYKTDNKGVMFEVEGKIPDGMVRFFNDFKKTYGEANYRDNQLHGYVKEFYEGGQIRREAKYIRGIIKSNKEYFIDGVVRMDADYHDSLRFVDNKKQDIGDGKIYYRDGRIMYKWNLTNSNRRGYSKSYDVDGRLVEENVFDEYGNLIETWDYRKAAQ